MRRCMAVVLGLLMIGLAMAQAPFNIVRPLNDSKVREKVHILIPKGSVPESGYVGVFVGGKFVEATMFQENGKYLEYVLDTKARGIPDGKLTIELVLYVEYTTGAKIQDRSSIDVTVSNSASIKVPADGFKLRYRFRPGSVYTYNVLNKVDVSTLTEAQNKLGGRAAELPVDSESIRLQYAIDNAYSNGDGLVRIQPLPQKGKDFAVLTTDDDLQPTKYMDFEMAPIYMRVTSTGLEVFGSAPMYIPLDGTQGAGAYTDLYVDDPLPTLPAKLVSPGDSWQSRFQTGALDMDKIHEVKKVSESDLARGEFVGVEWENGYPCAKLQNSLKIEKKSNEGKRLAKLGSAFTDPKISIEETIWFAIDQGVVVKKLYNVIVEGKIAAATTGNYGGNTAGTPGPMGGPMTGGPMSGPMSGPMGGGSVDYIINDPLILHFTQGRGGAGMPGGRMGGGRPAGTGQGIGGPPSGYTPYKGMGTGPGTGTGRSGYQAPQARYIRILIQKVSVLEK